MSRTSVQPTVSRFLTHARHPLLMAAAVLAMAAAVAAAADAKLPKRPKRSETFLGIHFDFHAGDDCTEIGKNTTREMVEYIIDQVHPDYLQIDCKGHPGLSSYPTKVGNQAPGFVGDPLRIWRQVTAERGVSLYMHYSGVWDSEAVKKHPEWAVLQTNGKPSARITSPFGPYVDKLLIPQLRELAGEYGVDGAWVDGECWATTRDYNPIALAEFRKATGVQDIPRNSSDPHWIESQDFYREAFRRYLRHYIAEVKKTNPNFEICSNWAFTDHMPEKVCAPVDFLSGDYSPENSVNSARLSGRYLARQGKNWDLMAWSFARNVKDKRQKSQKSAVQLSREAAVVVALGGGFQAYYKQNRDGSITPAEMPVMAAVAKFCRTRQAICHHSEAVPQVALLLSTAAHYRAAHGLFTRDTLGRVHGALQALLAGQQSVEVLGEHQLTGRMAEYPLIVVPEWGYLEPAFKAELADYAKAGGNLLLLGPAAAELFQAEMDVQLQGQPHDNQALHLTGDGVDLTATSASQAVALGAKAKPYGELRAAKDAPVQAAASITPFGKGKIAATYFNFAQARRNNHEQANRFLNQIVRKLFPAPMVEVQGSHDVDVCVARNHGKLLVNLVNAAGPHETVPVFDTIPPVGPLKVAIRQSAKPAKVTLEPAGKPLPFDFQDGKVQLTVPQVAIHEIIVVEAP